MLNAMKKICVMYVKEDSQHYILSTTITYGITLIDNHRNMQSYNNTHVLKEALAQVSGNYLLFACSIYISTTGCYALSIIETVLSER